MTRSPRVLFCGSRGRWPKGILLPLIEPVVAALPDDAIVLQGKAPGADAMSRHLAAKRGLFVLDAQVQDVHYARYGRRAPLMRNTVMGSLLASEFDWVEAFYSCPRPDVTHGTRDMVGKARALGVTVNEHWADDVAISPRPQVSVQQYGLL